MNNKLIVMALALLSYGIQLSAMMSKDESSTRMEKGQQSATQGQQSATPRKQDTQRTGGSYQGKRTQDFSRRQARGGFRDSGAYVRGVRGNDGRAFVSAGITPSYGRVGTSYGYAPTETYYAEDSYGYAPSETYYRGTSALVQPAASVAYGVTAPLRRSLGGRARYGRTGALRYAARRPGRSALARSTRTRRPITTARRNSLSTGGSSSFGRGTSSTGTRSVDGRKETSQTMRDAGRSPERVSEPSRRA
ncbi:hypothetical protein H0W26_02675 [Candidatus Dependentiae bacterium]|nr:hypothetical protein [Candidatus Dependentiae bacterium]